MTINSILNLVYEAQLMVEEMGASEELTALSIKLSEIKDGCEQNKKTMEECYPY